MNTHLAWYHWNLPLEPYCNYHNCHLLFVILIICSSFRINYFLNHLHWCQHVWMSFDETLEYARSLLVYYGKILQNRLRSDESPSSRCKRNYTQYFKVLDKTVCSFMLNLYTFLDSLLLLQRSLSVLYYCSDLIYSSWMLLL